MHMPQKKMLLIVNPRAGRSKSHGPLFDAAAAPNQGGWLLSIRRTAVPGDAVEIARTEAENYDAIVAVGGDGTLNETVSGLMRAEDPPVLGSASPQIPAKPEAAAELILRNTPRRLDIGMWNDRCFVYVASFGAFTRTSYTAPQAAKNALGHFAYILEGMKDLNSLRPYKIRATADGEVLDGEYLFGAVCNSTSIGGLMRLAPERVVLDDGLFELLLVPNPTNAQELQDLVRALLNQG